MSTMSTVNVIIDETGAATVSVEGCAGPACHDLTRALETALGTVTKDTRTPEFHKNAAHTQPRQQSLGTGGGT